MNRLKALYDHTLNMKEYLDREVTAKNRDEVIEHINNMLDERDILLKTVIPPYSNDEQKLATKITALSSEIEKNMEQIFNGVKEDIKKTKKQKVSAKQYINPYDKVRTNDGMYLDKKK